MTGWRQISRQARAVRAVGREIYVGESYRGVARLSTELRRDMPVVGKVYRSGIVPISSDVTVEVKSSEGVGGPVTRRELVVGVFIGAGSSVAVTALLLIILLT